MKTFRWLLVSLFLLLPLAAVRAQDVPVEEPGEEAGADEGKSMEDLMAQTRAMFTAMIDFVGDERLSEEEMKTVVAHAKAMDELYDEDGEDGEDDELQKKLDARYEKTGKYDLQIVLDDPQYKKLVADLDVDGKQFLKLFLRATLLETRSEMKAQLAEQEKSLPEQRKQAEQMREQFGDEAADQMLKMLDEAEKALSTWKTLIEKIPEANDEEKAAFEKHGAELRKILNGDDEEEMDEPGGWGGDDESGEEEGDE